jgi:perosamine synthetase
MDPAALERAITSKTRAVIAVHLYGHPADMERIRSIAALRGIDVIEDAAEAHGAEIDGKRVGSFGRCATFSFYGNKLITTGEGGMITTKDPALADRLRLLRDHAMSRTRKYWHTEIGYNYRLTNLQAAVGLAQLARIDALLARKRGIFARYERNLGGVPEARLNRTLPGYKNSYWMVCFEADRLNEASKALLMAELSKRNIDSRPYFVPLSDLPMYTSPPVSTPIAHELSRKGINLPSFVDMTEEMIDYVCQNVVELLRKT